MKIYYKLMMKAKIDEEMAKIKLSVGVYLPSNPDGSVIDLDRKSGRPLQSHAKVSSSPHACTQLMDVGTLHGYLQSPEGTIGDTSRSYCRYHGRV